MTGQGKILPLSVMELVYYDGKTNSFVGRPFTLAGNRLSEVVTTF